MMAYNQQPYYNGGYFPQYNNGASPDMLNQYKAQYQPMQMQQPMMQHPVQQMPMQGQQIPVQQSQTTPNRTQSNDIIWVQGEAGAKAYLVAPNTTITLWDSENPTIYVKTADSNGIPSMRVLDFVERTPNADRTQGNTPAKHECKCGKEFVRIKDFDELKAKYDDLEGIVKSMLEKAKATAPKSTKSKGEE